MSWKNAIFTEIIVKGGPFNSIKEGKGVGRIKFYDGDETLT